MNTDLFGVAWALQSDRLDRARRSGVLLHRDQVGEGDMGVRSTYRPRSGGVLTLLRRLVPGLSGLGYR